MESQRMANQVCGLCIRRREYCRLGGLPVAGDGTCDRHKYSAAHRPEINVPRMCMNCRRFRLRCEYVGGFVRRNDYCEAFRIDPVFIEKGRCPDDEDSDTAPEPAQTEETEG